MRAIREKEARLADTWITPTNGAPFDLERLLRFQRMQWSPEAATERDLFIVAVGSRTSAGQRHRNFEFSNGIVVDTELVPGMYNPIYRGLSVNEAIELWNERAEENNMDMPTAPDEVAAAALHLARLSCWSIRSQ